MKLALLRHRLFCCAVVLLAGTAAHSDAPPPVQLDNKTLVGAPGFFRVGKSTMGRRLGKAAGKRSGPTGPRTRAR